MTTTPSIDSELTQRNTLECRRTPPTAFQELLSHYAQTRSQGATVVVARDQQRDRLLAEYRRLFDEQFHHDLDYNLQQLWRWAQRLDSKRTVLREVRICDGFRRLSTLRKLLLTSDAWSTNEAENTCWIASQQFYCDALALADRLLTFDKGRLWSRRFSNTPRRYELNNGAAAYDLVQASANVLEQTVPNLLGVRPFRAVLPWLSHYGLCWILPWPVFRWSTFLGHARRFLLSNGFARMAGVEGDVSDLCGVEEFISDPYFFAPGTHRTRHNIIFALSHRHAALDIAFLASALRDLDHAVVANQAFFPRSAKRDSHIAMVDAGQSMRAVLAHVAEILTVQRIPLVIAVDGAVPYPPYGQQMRVKRGIRAIIEYMRRGSTGKRKTYIVPFTMNDVVYFLKGLDRQVKITIHKPICADDVAPPQSPCRWQASGRRSDPLLNHLELHFLANGGNVRHGWRTPRVIETVQRSRDQHDRQAGAVAWLRKHLHATIFDLSRG